MRKRPLAAAGISAGVVVVTTLGFVVGVPTAGRRVKRIEAAAPGPVAPVETLRPVATPFPSSLPTISHSPGCPQLANPGGLSWVPSANAGPWPTDGTVSIPALATTAAVVRVAVDATGRMPVPPVAGQVAWLDQGGVPGRTNNLVLAGHVTWQGMPGAFHRIGDLVPNDMVVLSIGGRRLTFRVTWVCEFPQATKLAAQIMGHTLVPSVTLITCAGGWDTEAGTHYERMVARAELIDG